MEYGAVEVHSKALELLIAQHIGIFLIAVAVFGVEGQSGEDELEGFPLDSKALGVVIWEQGRAKLREDFFFFLRELEGGCT